jgi:glyoxylase-like metal-dependent hydrolase (beta-lactamase superfamily II)/rhodanese-related sulfurtransferase
MTVRTLGLAACRTYLVACPRSREALLVDPVLDDAGPLASLVEGEGLHLRAVADTHTHADHPSAGPSLAERFGVPYALHEATACRRVGERLKDGASIEVGDLRVEVIHTPGHTQDSVTLRCGRDLMTGDFLFLAQEGAGRLDLPGGDPGAHWDSLRRLSALGDDLRVLPGHDYRGLSESTLGDERRRNPRFQRVTREEYVAWQKAVAAPTPDWMLDVIAANLGTGEAHGAHHGRPAPAAVADPAGIVGACAPGAAAGACASAATGRVPLLSPRAAWERLQAGAGGGAAPFFLDVREPWEHSGPRGRHAPGTVLIPLKSLPGSLDRVAAEREGEVIVICRSGGRSAQAAELLIEKGWRRVFSVDGGTDRWAAEGLPVES